MKSKFLELWGKSVQMDLLWCIRAVWCGILSGVHWRFFVILGLKHCPSNTYVSLACRMMHLHHTACSRKKVLLRILQITTTLLLPLKTPFCLPRISFTPFPAIQFDHRSQLKPLWSIHQSFFHSFPHSTLYSLAITTFQGSCMVTCLFLLSKTLSSL